MRRTFTKLTILLLSSAQVALFGALGLVFLAPPASEQSTARLYAVCRLSSLPADGKPIRLPVLAPHRDVGTRLPERVFGYVFVRKLQSGGVVTACQFKAAANDRVMRHSVQLGASEFRFGSMESELGQPFMNFSMSPLAFSHARSSS